MVRLLAAVAGLVVILVGLGFWAFYVFRVETEFAKIGVCLVVGVLLVVGWNLFDYGTHISDYWERKRGRR